MKGSGDARFAIARRNLVALAALCLVLAGPLPASAAEDSRPYDDKLLRLSEILGAVHFLRELCGADEGQLWRLQMAKLLEAEGDSSARRALLVNSFNSGYRSYRRTYQTCTSAAKDQTQRFLTEGADLTKTLAELK